MGFNMHLSDATWPDADTTEGDLALLPVGSTEQHGPHAPLSTDTLTAEAVSAAGVAAYDGSAVVAPALPYGISREHRYFAGTLWLTPDTFRAVLRDVIESLAHHGWEQIVIVNGHGGNTDAIREVAANTTRDGVAQTFAFTWFDAITADDMGHAGPVETSVLLHRAPDLVDIDNLEEGADGGSEKWGYWVSGTNLAYDSNEFTDNGVVGDPTTASETRGKELLDEAADALAELLHTVASS